MRLCVMASGSGTSLQCLIDAQKEGRIRSEIVLVVSNRPGAQALERAQKAGIATHLLQEDACFLEALRRARVELIVAAGFTGHVNDPIIDTYPNRILNMHPSLLPAYGGKGMYGRHVHQAVLDAQEPVTGATIQFMEKTIDTGKILLQERLPIDYSRIKTPADLREALLPIEHRLLLEVLSGIEQGQIAVGPAPDFEKGYREARA